MSKFSKQIWKVLREHMKCFRQEMKNVEEILGATGN
jgi:hypothetical protein